jgi:hypothetical protein
MPDTQTRLLILSDLGLLDASPETLVTGNVKMTH